MKNRKNKVIILGQSISVVLFGLFVFLVAAGAIFEYFFQGKIYPHVYIDNIAFGGKTAADVEQYLLAKNQPFLHKTFSFRFSGSVATLSAEQLDLGYDATLSATQAYLVGRSKHPFSNLYAKFFSRAIHLTPYFRWKTDMVDTTIESIAENIDIPVVDALFQFSNGKVSAFRPSRDGKRVNRVETKRRFAELVTGIPTTQESTIIIPLPVETIKPTFTTDRVNVFGIKERIGHGYSEFMGSIPGRIHNVALAASRLNGVLIKPGELFSFNDAIGDISAATGYQSAYIIKEGRTVLGDGGGVCQVSTTLFRAALSAGLPIAERRAHAYRVHYYEDGGFKPGIDATVFGPTVDLKIKNDTPAYILVQTSIDTQKMTLTFELYGTNDGRRSEILNHQVWGITPPPAPLYQDDPTLPKGRTKQVDFAAWGAKSSFQYKVTRNGETLQDQIFTSNFQPWRAVYLQGTL
ncbi:VanW family protein [Candidatus Gottesmanbacteria bacterium]|nr:VanW family protein [Candidatus Gottesmanbacteria bacterium]